MVEKKQEEVEAKAEVWNVSLIVESEDKLPKRVITDGELTLDLYEGIALMLNNQEKLKKLLD